MTNAELIEQLQKCNPDDTPFMMIEAGVITGYLSVYRLEATTKINENGGYTQIHLYLKPKKEEK